MKGKIAFLAIGAIASPIILFFGKLAVFAAGIAAIAVTVNIFAQEMKKLEEQK